MNLIGKSKCFAVRSCIVLTGLKQSSARKACLHAFRDLLGTLLLRRYVRNDLVDLLIGHRATARTTPRRHRRVRATVVQDVLDLRIGEAVEHRTQRRSYPVDLFNEYATGVHQAEVCSQATVAVHRAMALGTVGLVQVGPLSHRLGVGEVNKTFLASWFTQPIQRQSQRDDGQRDQTAG